nr:MAG TPA: hypothetical protein [Caudoviricetes sp.]
MKVILSFLQKLLKTQPMIFLYTPLVSRLILLLSFVQKLYYPF